MLTDNKVQRFMTKWNITRNNADKSNFYEIPEVLARNMEALVKCYALRIVLEPTWIGNTDQSMMCNYSDRLTSYCTTSSKRNHGKKTAPSGSRITWTHNPHLLLNLDTRKPEIGESQVQLLQKEMESSR